MANYLEFPKIQTDKSRNAVPLLRHSSHLKLRVTCFLVLLEFLCLVGGSEFTSISMPCAKFGTSCVRHNMDEGKNKTNQGDNLEKRNSGSYPPCRLAFPMRSFRANPPCTAVLANHLSVVGPVRPIRRQSSTATTLSAAWTPRAA